MTKPNLSKQNLLSHADLISVLDYDKSTGFFYNKISRKGGIKKDTKAGSKLKTTGTDKYCVRIRIFGKYYYAHRLAWFYVYGEWPEGSIDHIDGNPLNNSINNLRCATAQQQQKNKSRYKTNKSGYTGVYWCKENKKWRATITHNKKIIYIGLFSDLLLAAEARKKAQKKYGFHENHGRN